MRPLWQVVREIFDRQRGLLPRKIAEETGYSVFSVLRWGEEPRRINPNGNGYPVPASAVPVITRLSEDPSLLREIADEAGYLIIRKPEFQDPATVSRVIREFGDLLSTYGRAIQDGKITPEEYYKIRREGLETVEAILGLLEKIKQEV